MEDRSILGLDLVRFSAAAMVAWFHLAYWSWAGGAAASTSTIVAGTVYFPSLAPTAWWGGIGVQIFFVLSGFVIAFSAEGKRPAEFVVSRFLRLYPAVWVCAPMAVVSLLIYGTEPLLQLLRKLVRSVALFPSGPWVDGVYWTLGIEIVFYSLVFLLLIARQFHRASWLFLAISLPSVLVWIGWFLGFDTTALRGSRYLDLALTSHGCYFGLGGFIWAAWKGKLSAPFVVGAGLCLIAGAIGVYAGGTFSRTGYSSLVPTAVWTLAVACICLSVRYNTGISRVFAGRQPLVRAVGLATYPLYLLHNILGAGVMRAFRDAGLPQELALPGALAVILATSFAVAIYIEPRVRNVTRMAMTSVWPRRSKRLHT